MCGNTSTSAPYFLLAVLSFLDLLPAGLLFFDESIPDQSMFGLKSLGGFGAVINQAETGRFPSSEFGAEAKERNQLRVHDLVALRPIKLRDLRSKAHTFAIISASSVFGTFARPG